MSTPSQALDPASAASPHQVPGDRFVDPGLLCQDDNGVTTLCGSRCAECGVTTFPAQSSCPRCAGTDMSAHSLPRRGVLWTFTIQRFRPKPPYDGPIAFEPYAVGYIDLANQILVESRLLVRPNEILRIGDHMELIFTPYTSTPDGETVTTFAFRRVADEARPL
jgi:uncharacterized OB-fold protein